MNYTKEFSFIVAVYNVQEYLEEAINSLLNQKEIDLSLIEVILVDDGSPDESPEICDRYAQIYPDIVRVFHKTNGGVSSARNLGLSHAVGRFVCFMDSDDKISENVCFEVSQFLQAHDSEVDVVAFPMKAFGASNKESFQNQKFSAGTRVINLRQNPDVYQMSTSCCFIRMAVLQEKNLLFDHRLKIGEDAKLIQRVLWEKQRIGVVSNAWYYYRSRGDEAAVQSATQGLRNSKTWWLNTLEYYIIENIDYAKEQFGYLPAFFQYNMLHQLAQRFQIPEIDRELFSNAEVEQLKADLRYIMQNIDDNLIMQQKSVFSEIKMRMLQYKYDSDCMQYDSDTGLIYFDNLVICSLMHNLTRITNVKISHDNLIIEGIHNLIVGPYSDVIPAFKVNDTVFPCTGFQVYHPGERYSLDEKIVDSMFFRFSFDLTECSSFVDEELIRIESGVIVDGTYLSRYNVRHTSFSPFNSYNSSYYVQNGWLLQKRNHTILLRVEKNNAATKMELRYLRDIYRRKKSSGLKAIFMRIGVQFAKRFIRKPIWIVSDRLDRSDDNGEVFFSYLCREKSKEINAFFAILPDSPDYERMKAIGKTVPILSRKYKWLMLLAEWSVSSQAEEYYYYPYYDEVYRDISQVRFAFLQHGVIMNDLSNWLHKSNKDIDVFVTTTRSEYASILDPSYGYTTNEVFLTGLPRHDRLADRKKKQITIMPTWRSYLVSSQDKETGKRSLLSGFKDSGFYIMYEELFNSTRLFDEAERLGYQICYMPHPNMISANDQFHYDERMTILPLSTSYNAVFCDSALMITDYSSVQFDFAYMRKPILYYQADEKEFFSGKHTVQKGYFDYRRDGFGEVTDSADTLVDLMISYMQNDCQLKEEYRQRIEQTFPFHDQNNCERVFQVIRDKDIQNKESN